MEGSRLFWRILAISGVFLVQIEKGECSQELLQNMSKGFSAGLEECKKQENIGDHIMQDFYNFWHEEYQLVNRELGCMMMCMASKLELIDEDMKLHHGNAHEFAKTHGADDDLAKQIVSMVHECEKANDAVTDHCARALEIAKCFRTKIHALKWAPSMRVVMEEVMTAL